MPLGLRIGLNEGLPSRSIGTSMPSRRKLVVIHTPIGPGPSMSLGTSSTMEKMLAPVKGFESMSSMVLPGLSGAVKTNRSVRSRRASSPGDLRSAALKWFDMVAPSVVLVRVVLRPGSAAQEVEQGGVDLIRVGPGDGV